MKKLGLFIGRMNPPHKWHIAVIQKALSENDQTLILLWDNWVVDESNPLNFIEREWLLKRYFWNNNNLDTGIIKDTKTDLDWVQSIADKIQKYWNLELNIYWWDFEKDSAIVAMKQYELLLWEKVNYIPVDRFLETIEYNGEEAFG